MKICKGCGAHIQTTDKNMIGYTPKEDSDYCQRCFRLMHYDDLTVSMRTGIDPDFVLEKIQTMDALVLWVVDLFDFEAGMINGIGRKLEGKDIIIVCAKRDILPETLSYEKAARFVFGRLKELGVKVKGFILTSKLQKDGIDEVKHAVSMLAGGRDVVVMGRANAGKSTLLNNLLGKTVLVSSRYPGTTLDFNELMIDGQKYIDTPGIEIQSSMLMSVAEEDLKTILPYKTIKPKIYQIYEDQSFAIGGLVRLDLVGVDEGVVTWYLSDRLPIHRSKVRGADELWRRHYGEMLKPIPLDENFVTKTVNKKYAKMDVVIDGLGWATLHGQISQIIVRAPKSVNITFRKAML